MALKKREKAVYLNVSGGKLRERVREGDSDAIKRTTDSGKVVWEREYDAITGHIQKMFYTTHKEYGTKLNITMKGDDSVKYILQLNEGAQGPSRYYMDFLHKLPNLNLDEEIEFAPYQMKDGERINTGLVIYQDGNKIPSYFKTVKKLGEEYKTTFHHDYPEYEGKKGDKNAWKIYMLTCKSFLEEFTKDIMDDFNAASTTNRISEDSGDDNDYY